MSHRYSELDLAQALANNPDLKLARQNSAIRGDLSHAGREEYDATLRRITPAGAAIAPQSTLLPPLSFTVLGSPVPKPRQTRRDKWAKRPCVLRYREWADLARLEAKRALGRQLKGLGVASYSRIKIVAFLPIPVSWSKVQKAALRGQPHQSRPDADNLAKSSCDALYPTRDEYIYDVQISKYWDDGNGPRTVITLW